MKGQIVGKGLMIPIGDTSYTMGNASRVEESYKGIDEEVEQEGRDDIIRVPGNSHGTIPDRVPRMRPSSLLSHLAHSPCLLVSDAVYR